MRACKQLGESRALSPRACDYYYCYCYILADIDWKLDDPVMLPGLMVEVFQCPSGAGSVAQAESDVGWRNFRHIALPGADRRLQPPTTGLYIRQNTSHLLCQASANYFNIAYSPKTAFSVISSAFADSCVVGRRRREPE